MDSSASKLAPLKTPCLSSQWLIYKNNTIYSSQTPACPTILCVCVCVCVGVEGGWQVGQKLEMTFTPQITTP